MAQYKLSVSIVTYNNEKEIDGILNSLQKSSIIDDMKIIVVDNHSSDNTVDKISSKYRNINLLKSNENLGYGKGHNKAILNAQSKYHLIVNPDITFENNVIENLIAYMDKNPTVVLCAPNAYDDQGNLKSPPKKDPQLRYILGRYFDKYGGVFRKWNNQYAQKNLHLDSPAEIEFCPGCFMLARTEVLKKVGGFDKRYFLYFEDADLSREMRRHGRIICHPNYGVVHEGKRESHKSFKGFKMIFASMFKYFNKWGWRF